MGKVIVLEPYEYALILRRRLALDQSQAASLVGVQRQTVAQVENNKAAALTVRAVVAALEEAQKNGTTTGHSPAQDIPNFDIR